MKFPLAVLVGLCAAVGLAVALLYHFTSPLAGLPTHHGRPVSVRDLESSPPPTHTSDAESTVRRAPESLRRGAARAHYRELLASLRRAAEQRAAQAGPEVPQAAEPTEPDYAPEGMPRPGTRVSDAPIPTREEQDRFFAALTEQADPLVDDCYRALPEPRPQGTLMLVWTTVYDEEVGTVVERVELDEASEVTDTSVLECARESIFSVDLPDLDGYGRLQVTSHQYFDGQSLADEPGPR